MAIQLTTLVEVSKPYLLAYALPLLLLSIVIAFAGTFLTLDRTRTFAPRSDATPPIPGDFDEKPSKIATLCKSFRLDGGLGGLAMGYVFGLHASTFLSLLIMNESSASTLTPTTFLVVWVFSIMPTTFLGGRWRVAALLFTGLTGGITMSLGLCIITHPSLTSRVVISSIFTPLVTLAVVVPSLLPSLSMSGLAHSTTRTATSCAGAFSVTMAIALLTRSQSSYSWGNAWERLWISDGDGWGTSREKGFDTLFCALWTGGALADWTLKRWIGEDPDEKWDSYLADYVSSLPNVDDRAGNFRPLPSWWDRLMKTLHLSSPNPAHPHEILFPSDAELALKPEYISVPDIGDDEKPAAYPSKPDLQRAISPVAFNWRPPSPVKGAGFLRKEKPAKFFVSNGDPDLATGDNMFDLGRQPTFLKKAKTARVERRKQRIAEKSGRRRLEFRPVDGFSSDSDELSSDMDELKTPVGTPTRERDIYVHTSPLERAHSASATSLSGTTVNPPSGTCSTPIADYLPGSLDIHEERARLANIKQAFGASHRAPSPTNSIPDYSGIEEDVTAAFARHPDAAIRDTPGWQPAFMRRASSSGSSNTRTPKTTEAIAPPGAVPVTPSLVQAVERINRAHSEAYGYRPAAIPTPGDNWGQQQYPPIARRDHIAIDVAPAPRIPGLPIISEEQKQKDSEDWDELWKEIREKANDVPSQH